MSMPDAPSVRVLPGPIETAPPGLVMLRPRQLRSAPSDTALAAVTMLLHWAASPAPGTTRPDQLVVKFRLSVLLALVNVAACESRVDSATSTKTAIFRK